MGAFVKKIFIVMAIFWLMASPSQAYFSTFDTADTLEEGENQLGLETQYIFDNMAGGSILGRFDTGVGDGSVLRFDLGAGTTSLEAGAFFKFVPIPDYQNQPGIGFDAGVVYASINGNSVLSFRVHPLISKGFQTTSGQFTPYLSVPLGVTFNSGLSSFPVQIEGGVKWLPSGLRHLTFWGEVGIELNAAFSYASVGLSVPFDGWDRISLN